MSAIESITRTESSSDAYKTVVHCRTGRLAQIFDECDCTAEERQVVSSFTCEEARMNETPDVVCFDLS